MSTDTAPLADILPALHDRVEGAVIVLTIDKTGKVDLSHVPWIHMADIIRWLRDLASDLETEEPKTP